MEHRRRSLDLLDIALERRYLDAEQVDRVRHEARVRRCAPERLIVEWRMLSLRRIERLRLHLQYRTMRQADKSYVRLAIRRGWLQRDLGQEALLAQRRAFERGRSCRRVGAILIEAGGLTPEQDRRLRGALSERRAPAASAAASAPRRSDEDSAATLALHESSVAGSGGGRCTKTFHALEAALERVEAIRAITADLSTSDQPGLTPARADSAEELENACQMLARRRVRVDAPARKSGKGTGKLAALLGRGAA